MYAYEARPYGILLGCCAAALLSWQYSTEQQRRNVALAALGSSLAIAVSCHYYAGLILLPLMAGELVRSLIRRRCDRVLWAVMLCGVAPILIYIPLIKAAMQQHDNEHVWNKPELSFLWESYWVLLGFAVVPLGILIAGSIARKIKERHAHVSPSVASLPYHEVVAVSVLACLPIIGLAAAFTVTNMITDRYVLPMLVGCSIAFAFSCWKLAEGRSAVAFTTASVLLFSIAAVQVHDVNHFVHLRARYSNVRLDSALSKTDEPIVVKSLQVLPFQYYAAPQFRSRVVCLVDFGKQYEFQNVNTPELLLILGRDLFPVNLVTNLDDFTREHRRFFIYGGPVGAVENDVFKHGGVTRIEYKNTQTETFLMHADYDAKSQPLQTSAALRVNK
jgi:hypothetical protein